MPDGSLFGVIRNEEGDESGWGSKLCRATSAALGAWTCTDDPRKFDSPNVFLHDGEVYFFARRNLANDGRYDLGVGSGLVRMLRNQLGLHHRRPSAARSGATTGRPEQRGLRAAIRLSRGDTCFASSAAG